MDGKSYSSIRPGLKLPGGYVLLESIGKGSFSEIFSASAPPTPAIESTQNQSSSSIGHNEEGGAVVRKVAVKIQEPGFDSSVLRWESSVMQALRDVPHVPAFYALGQHDKRDYIIMELLSQEDMASIRNRIRASSPTGLVPAPLAVYFACQMITCLQPMHEHGFVHRDVKPSNFVRAKNDKDGVIKSKREKAEFRGTTIYASPFVHEGQDQCPRDDLCSVLHVFFDMLCGKLPWGDAARMKDKATVAAIKRKCYDDIEYFIDWERTQVRSTEESKGVVETNFPVIVQESCRSILTHLKSLDYESTPDYSLLFTLFRACLPEPAEVEAVSELTYSLPGFSWQRPISSNTHATASSSSPGVVALPTRMSTNSLSTAEKVPMPSVNPSFIQYHNLALRIHSLHNSIQSKGAELSREELYSLALRWQHLAKDVIDKSQAQGEEKYLLELTTAFQELAAVLALHQHFLLISLGEKEEKWAELGRLQETIASFYTVMVRLRKRRREALEMEI
eukprot:scaffold1690_cov177-Ochromonas_danica.AAC.4